ncbi:MAG: hypothetical protein H6729_04465 [Deltaproteobacteria bacterium]|nr:hypothetical protein [Deltaproteobacteria bacterium]
MLASKAMLNARTTFMTLLVAILCYRLALALDPPKNLHRIDSSPTSSDPHPFPFSFSDPDFFANMSSSAPIDLTCGSRYANLTVTQHREPAALINQCESGVTTISQVRLGGDGGVNGNIREGYRCAGGGTMNIERSWLESTGSGDDHADTIQCYDPGNTPTARLDIRNTTIRAHTASATAGIFIADAYAVDLYLTNVLFWGGPYGLRVHPDGRPGSVHLNHVCFYGEGDANNDFGYGPFIIDGTIAEWNDVHWCTIEAGQLVVHGAIQRP